MKIWPYSNHITYRVRVFPKSDLVTPDPWIDFWRLDIDAVFSAADDIDEKDLARKESLRKRIMFPISASYALVRKGWRIFRAEARRCVNPVPDSRIRWNTVLNKITDHDFR